MTEFGNLGVEIPAEYVTIKYKENSRKEGKKVSKTLLRETGNIAAITLILGALEVLVTVPLGYFGIPAVLGTLLGCAVAVFNFALMGIILERCISRGKSASWLMGMGYIVRLAIIAASILWAIKAPYLNYICAVIPLLFPRIAIFIINSARKKKERKPENDERT